MELNTIKPADGAKKNKRRLGRGIGSGLGKTAGRGHKGQKSRAGGFHKVGFEGGQMPLIRRLPKRGFTNIFKKAWIIVNIRELTRFPADTVVDADVLSKAGLIKKTDARIKLLGQGAISVPLTVRVQGASVQAKEIIEAQGGKVEVI